MDFQDSSGTSPLGVAAVLGNKELTRCTSLEPTRSLPSRLNSEKSNDSHIYLVFIVGANMDGQTQQTFSNQNYLDEYAEVVGSNLLGFAEFRGSLEGRFSH